MYLKEDKQNQSEKACIVDSIDFKGRLWLRDNDKEIDTTCFKYGSTNVELS